MLNANNAKMVEICKLGDTFVSEEEMQVFMKEEEDKDHEACPDEVLAGFLNGLIISKRGKDPNRPPPPLELPMSNNQVLKKLRVAFELKEEDMLQIIGANGFEFTKAELSALVRARDHRNYRVAQDQVLRNFLKGLTSRVHEKTEKTPAAKA